MHMFWWIVVAVVAVVLFAGAWWSSGRQRRGVDGPAARNLRVRSQGSVQNYNNPSGPNISGP